MNEQLAALLVRAVAHRDRTLQRYGQDSYQTRAAERAVEAIKRGG